MKAIFSGGISYFKLTFFLHAFRTVVFTTALAVLGFGDAYLR